MHMLHRKIKHKLNISIGAGLKHHSMSWREMMMIGVGGLLDLSDTNIVKDNRIVHWQMGS